MLFSYQRYISKNKQTFHYELRMIAKKLSGQITEFDYEVLIQKPYNLDWTLAKFKLIADIDTVNLLKRKHCIDYFWSECWNKLKLEGFFFSLKWTTCSFNQLAYRKYICNGWITLFLVVSFAWHAKKDEREAKWRGCVDCINRYVARAIRYGRSNDRLCNSFWKSITWIYRLSVAVSSVIMAHLLTMPPTITSLCNSERVREKNSIMGNNVLHNNIF